MRKNNRNQLALSIIMVLLLTACGGGSSNGSTSTTTITAPKIGSIVDAPISNLVYSCGSILSKTDAQGRFACTEFPVTFSISGIEVGSIDAMTADTVIYPQDLVGVNRNDFNNEEVLKIAIFLQSLDDDGEMGTAITIPDTLVLNGNQKLKDLTLEEVKKLLIDNGIDPMSEASAKEHLRIHSSIPQEDTESNADVDETIINEEISSVDKPILLTSLSSATNSESITIEIEGLADGKIFVNGVEQGRMQSNGKAELLLDLVGEDGVKSFAITLKNNDGVESLALVVTIIKDTIAPDMPLLETSISTETTSNLYTIYLLGEENSTVYLDGSNTNSIIRNGRATIEVGLAVGNNQFDITLKDEAKNTSEPLTVNITRKAPPQMSDAEAVDKATSALSLGDTSSVSSNMSLPTTGLYGTTITYISSNTAVLSNTGVVTQPESGSVTVTLTATISKGSSSATKNFSITIVEELPTF